MQLYAIVSTASREAYNQLHLQDKLDLYATIHEYNLDKLTKYMFRPDVASGVFILIYLY